jgi:ribosomal protein S18 acetylase RimI-like enzyme
LKSALKDPDYELWIAEANGEIVGFIDLWTIHDFCHGGKLSFIENLYVAPKYRWLGVGSRLLQKLVERAEEMGVLEIHIVTEFDNEPAIRLYKKHGLTKESLQLEKNSNNFKHLCYYAQLKVKYCSFLYLGWRPLA